MISEAIDRIISLSRPNVQQIDGREYTDKKLTLVGPPPVEARKLSTLRSLVDYLKNDVDDFAGNGVEALVHVVSPSTVEVLDALAHKTGTRNVFIRCVFEHEGFGFGQPKDLEQFLIALQARFVKTAARDAVLACLGNAQAQKVTTSVDDGMTQTVARKVGAVLEDRVAIKNPVILAPHRTFPEVEQPESPFILRLHQRDAELPKPALYEADGGAWQLEAITRIAAFLSLQLDGHVILA